MKLFLSRKEKKLHCLLWVLNAEEYATVFELKPSLLGDSSLLKQVNSFLSAKDPLSFMKCIEGFEKPMWPAELNLDPSFGSDAFGIKRVHRPASFFVDYEKGIYTSGSRRMLAHECWFILPGFGASFCKESSATKAIKTYDPDDESALKKAVVEAGEGAVIIEESLQDWIWLKNMTAIALSLKKRLCESRISGFNDPLQRSGFFKAKYSGIVPFKGERVLYEYRVPVMRSDYIRFDNTIDMFKEVVEDYNRLTGRRGFFRWSPYSKLGFKKIKGPFQQERLVMVSPDKNNCQIHYLIDEVSTSEESTDRSKMLFLCFSGSFSSEFDAGSSFLRSLLTNRFAFESYGFDFGDAECRFSSKTLSGQIWLTIFGAKGIHQGCCDVCGLPFFVKGKTKKLYCSKACKQSLFN